MISAVSNTNSFHALFALRRNEGALSQSLERLSSGKKVNAGKDGPAALISAERLAAEIAALEAESRSLERAGSAANIADGHLSQLSSMYQELNRLVVAGANEAGLIDGEREAYQLQIDSVVSNIQRFSGDAVSSLNGFNMPDGANTEVAAQLQSAAASASTLISGGDASLRSGDLEAAQKTIAAGLTDVLNARGTIGAYQRYSVDARSRSLQVTRENLLESKSRLIDTDFAEETSNLTRAQVLTTANVKTLKIAQQQSHLVLQLLA